MKSTLAEQMYLDTREGQSEAGDTIEFQAEMDTIVGLSACPAFAIRSEEAKPLDIEIPSGVPTHTNF